LPCQRKAGPAAACRQITDCFNQPDSETHYIDTSAAVAIEDMLASASEETEQCYVCGLSGITLETLLSLGSLDSIPKAHIFESRVKVIAALAS